MEKEQEMTFAEIESLSRDEVNEMIGYLAKNCILKPVEDLRRELGITRSGNDANAKHLIEIIKKYNLQFTLRIKWPKKILSQEERLENANKEVPDMNSTMNQPAFMREMDDQSKAVKNPDLKSLDVSDMIDKGADQNTQSGPPSLPDLGNL